MSPLRSSEVAKAVVPGMTRHSAAKPATKNFLINLSLHWELVFRITFCLLFVRRDRATLYSKSAAARTRRRLQRFLPESQAADGLDRVRTVHVHEDDSAARADHPDHRRAAGPGPIAGVDVPHHHLVSL